MKKLLKRLIGLDFLAAVTCFLYFLAGSLININRYWQYDLGYYDFGIFDVAIWKLSQFKLPIIDHFIVPGKISLADHFNPGIFLLTPIYWITSRGESILVLMCLLVALSGYVLYRIGNKLVGNKLISYCVMGSYFLFVGLQNAVYSDFHELTMATFFIMMTYYGIISKNKKIFWIFFILTLGFKETLFVFGVGLSFFIFFYEKSWRRTALYAFLYSLIYGYITTQIVIPFLASGAYYYAPKIGSNIPNLISKLYTPVIKIKTFFLINYSFLFLPLFNLLLLPIILLNLIGRFLSEGSTRWDLGLHYNAEIAPTLAISVLLVLYWIYIKNKKVATILAVIMLLNSLFIHRFVLHGPIQLAINPIFYNNKSNFKYIDKAIKKIPTNTTISAQNNLTVPFFHTNEVYILRDNYRSHNPGYILIDVREGQQPGNYLGISKISDLLFKIKKDKDYFVYYNDGSIYIFKKR
jgi:uncharacterized membrane protein